METSFKYLLFPLLGSALLFIGCSMNSSEFSCAEEPFNSLVTPIVELDTAVFIEPGDVIQGGKGIVFRLVDSNNKEVYLVAVRKPNSGIDSIIVNPPINWEWDERSGIVPDVTIPSDLYDLPKSYRTIEDVESAVKDLTQILKKYRRPNDKGIDIALDSLKK